MEKRAQIDADRITGGYARVRCNVMLLQTERSYGDTWICHEPGTAFADRMDDARLRCLRL
jgi:hypothetical protein